MLMNPKFMLTDDGKPYIKVDVENSDHFNAEEGVARMIGKEGVERKLTLIPMDKTNNGHYLICFDGDQESVKDYENFHNEALEERRERNREFMRANREANHEE